MTFEESVNYPRQGPDPLRTILIGGILSLLGFLLIPAILVLGYLMRALGHSIDGAEEPPQFDDWGELLVTGLEALAISIVYLVIPAIVFGASVGGIVLEAVLTGDVSVATIAGSLVGFFLSFLLFLLAWYILPAALANFAAKDRIGAGFAFGDIRPVIFHGRYAINWLLALALFVAGSVVVGFLGIIPPLGFIAGGFVFFYLDIVAVDLYGRAYAKASAAERAPDSPAGQPVA